MLNFKDKGLTLLELLIIMIAIGVLAVIAFTQYRNMSERARYAEALTIMDKLRKAEWMYYQKNDLFTSVGSDLMIEPEFLPSYSGSSCSPVSWFTYYVQVTGCGGGNDFCVDAIRCHAMLGAAGAAGKPPIYPGYGYQVRMYANGSLACERLSGTSSADFKCPVANLPQIP